MGTCQTLLTFLESLKPKAQEEDLELNQTPSWNDESVQESLKSGDWKKEKIHILKKKEEDWTTAGSLSKKHKKKGKKQQKGAQEDTQKISLNIDILDDFDKIKVSPPLYMKEIDTTVKSLNEKKDYFNKISDDLNDGKEVENDKKQEDDKKSDDKEETEQPKKERKAKVNLEDENMFP